jgi:hypothetical protein
MRSPKPISSLLFAAVLALCSAQSSLAQYAISSIAGGGPNNLPAVKASIGFPQAVAFDSAGNAYIANAYLPSQIFKVSTTGTLTLIAGNGSIGYAGDGGPATAAALNQPEGIFVDGSGNVFIADSGNSVIREVVASTGVIQTVAGNGTSGYAGDGGPATGAELNDPFGVFVDGAGNIFIADTDNSVIREVTASNNNIQTVAGNFAAGAGYAGDGGAATSAQLNMPEGVFVDAAGAIFIADTVNSVIREVAAAGNIQTIAGASYTWSGVCNYSGDGATATAAQLCLPNSIFVDGAGDVFIADTQNFVIRVVNPSAAAVTIAGVSIAPGDIQKIAGTAGTAGYSGDGAAATAAELNYPGGVAADAAGDVFIADTSNYVIREIANSTGTIQTFAGNATLSYSGDGGPATGAQLGLPGGAFADAPGDVYIADTNNSAIRFFNAGMQPVTIAGVTVQPGDIETIVGTGAFCAAPAPGGCGDGGTPTSAALNFPYSVFLDSAGNIYIADTGLPLTESSAIRVVNTGAAAITIAGTTIQPNTIETVAGTLGSAGFAGDGGAPTSAQFSNPQGVAVDAAGNIFIADTGNSAIRVVNTGTQALVIGNVTVQPGTIGTVVGTPPTACPDSGTGCGDNGAATAAFLNFPTGVSIDAAGDIFIADSSNSAVRVVNPGTQPVTIAGTVIPPADILTVAGTLGRDGYSGDNGPPTSALLNNPFGVWVDSLGNIFIADTDNSAIREVVSIAATIQTAAGTGTAGFSGDGGSSSSATLNGPEDVVLGGGGNVYIADSQNSRIRKLISTVTAAVDPGSTLLPLGGTQQFLANVTGTANAAVTWQVNGVTSGSAAAGTISTAGLYQAPATAPGSGITVTAISNANGTTSGSAQVSLAASGSPAISVSTTPAGVTVVYTTYTQAFAATVSGETNTAVNWEVNGELGGDSAIGTIDTTGLYTAPATVPPQPLVTITAVSQADASVSGVYPLTIVAAPTAGQGTSQTVSPGGTATFSLSLNANTGSPQNAITLSCQQSSLPTGATCSFTPATVTPSSSPVSFSLAVSVPSSSAAMLTGNSHSLGLATELSFGMGPLGALLMLSRKRRQQSLRRLGLAMMALFLLSLAGCGGGNGSPGPNLQPQTYNIQVQGTTAAQPTPVPITMVKLTVM